MILNRASISQLASAVRDNGRRGEPRAGCDCMQCFGYCIVNEDQALRDRALVNDAAFFGERRLDDDFKLEVPA